MQDYFVFLADLEILARHRNLGLVDLERVLFLHLDPKNGIMEAGHSDNARTEWEGLPGTDFVCPGDHDVFRDAHPDENLILRRLEVRDAAIRVTDWFESDLHTGVASRSQQGTGQTKDSLFWWCCHNMKIDCRIWKLDFGLLIAR